MKDARASNNSGAAVEADAAAVARDPREERRWAREVLRRGALELLYLGSNVAIVGGILFWGYRLLTHKPALATGLSLAAAVSVSLAAYHFARWRASSAMSHHVENLTACAIATLGMALVWGGICFAFSFGALRWFSATAAATWIIAAAAGLCGFAYLVRGEWSELRDCLAPPEANPSRHADASTV